MSLLRWLFGKKSTRSSAAEQRSDLSRMESTRPFDYPKAHPVPVPPASKAPATAAAQDAARKSERATRREQLYSVVREAMVCAGILSAAYKFKVLSLDQRGHQFLVMMDLSSEFGGDTGRLSEIEVMIAQNAKSRHEILVSSVYWRMSDHVAIGRPGSSEKPPVAVAAAVEPAPVPKPPSVVPLAAAALAVDPVVVASAAAQPVHATGFEPLQDDEVAAFRQALAAGAAARPAAPLPAAATNPAAVAPTAAVEAPNYTFLTGYEDTEMPDPNEPVQALGATQYGELH